jgi:15-cis-phytoene synthase
VATSLLPPAKRRAIRVLYAFCRASDDIVDCSRGDREAALAAWRRKVLVSAPCGGELSVVSCQSHRN